MMWSNSFPYHDKYEIVEFLETNTHTQGRGNWKGVPIQNHNTTPLKS